MRAVATWWSRGGGNNAGGFDDVVYDGVQLGEVGAREVVLVLLLGRRGHVPQKGGVDLFGHSDRDHLN